MHSVDHRGKSNPSYEFGNPGQVQAISLAHGLDSEKRQVESTQQKTWGIKYVPHDGLGMQCLLSMRIFSFTKRDLRGGGKCKTPVRMFLYFSHLLPHRFRPIKRPFEYHEWREILLRATGSFELYRAVMNNQAPQSVRVALQYSYVAQFLVWVLQQDYKIVDAVDYDFVFPEGILQAVLQMDRHTAHITRFITRVGYGNLMYIVLEAWLKKFRVTISSQNMIRLVNLFCEFHGTCMDLGTNKPLARLSFALLVRHARSFLIMGNDKEADFFY